MLSSDADPSTLVPPATGGLNYHTPPPLKPLLTLPDDRGNTAVHVAARDGCVDALTVLLESAVADLAAAESGGADGDTGHPTAPAQQVLLMHRNRAGQTALHCAVLGGCADSVAALAAACPAAFGVEDRLGFTPPQLAQRRRCGAEVFQGLGVAGDAEAVPAHAAGASHTAPALLVTSPDCLAHHTAKPPLLRGTMPPPENIRRLEVRRPGGCHTSYVPRARSSKKIVCTEYQLACLPSYVCRPVTGATAADSPDASVRPPHAPKALQW